MIGSQEEVSELSRNAMACSHIGSAAVYGTDCFTEPETAAFLNAAAGHSLDLDDWEIPGNSHSSVVLLPAILAASSAVRLSGHELCEAYTAGFEVIARMGEAINFEHYARGWHTTGTLACIGAAAAIARLWKLSPSQTANTISIAISRAAGMTCQFGAHAKPLQAGFAAENGLRSARLARHGLTGQPHALEGEQGYFALTGHNDVDRYRKPFQSLGVSLAIEEYGQIIKPYPSCGYTHRIIDCARKLKQRLTDCASIASIRLYLPDFHAVILPFKQPVNRKEALFSLPFCAAMGLTTGNVTIEDLNREYWLSDEIKRLISVTEVFPFKPSRPQLNYDPQEPDRMEVMMQSGEQHSESVAYPTGSPQSPLTLDQLLAKFRYNLSKFRQPSESEIQQLLNWPVLEDLHPLLHKLVVKSAEPIS